MNIEKFGFLKVAVFVPKLKISDVAFNCGEISSSILKAKQEGAFLVLFPQLCLSSCSCEDMFFSEDVLNEVEKAVLNLADLTKELNICAVIGLPVRGGGKIFNCAAFLADGEIKGFVPKISTGGSCENRWFCGAESLNGNEICFGGKKIPIGVDLVFEVGKALIGIEICEDVLVFNSPARCFHKAGVNVILNLAAVERTVEAAKYVDLVLKAESFRQHCAYLSCFAGALETSTDSVYLGYLAAFEDGKTVLKKQQQQFESLFACVDIDLNLIEKKRQKFGFPCYKENEVDDFRIIRVNFEFSSFKIGRRISKMPYFSEDFEGDLEDIFKIQVLGLLRRVEHVGCEKLVVAVSGGLDSALAVLVATEVCGLLNWNRSSVVAVTMPGFGTSAKTLNNAKNLISELGASFKQIDIKASCRQHFEDIGQEEDCFNLVFENSQARERAQILLDFANKVRGLVVGSANVSELSLGFTTFAGDHISMYCVNCGVFKTVVRKIVEFKAKTATSNGLRSVLNEILETPISPELLPLKMDGSLNQKTEEFLGEYILHDFFLYHFVKFGFSVEKIKFLACCAFKDCFEEEYISKTLKTFVERFFSQQFKRSCLPDGPKVFSFSLSPRNGLKLASDCCSRLWIERLN